MEENFEELFNKSVQYVELGKTVTGTIITITRKNEIFVDLGYKADGIIPYKEYTDDEEKDPHDEFKPGDKITADILKMNDGMGNVLLSYKRANQRNYRKEFDEKVKNNEIFREKVSSVNEKGLITEHKGVRIFIPLSLSGISRGEDPKTYIGKEIEFLVIENQNNRIIGSIKEIKDLKQKQAKDSFWGNVEVGKKYNGIVKGLSSYGAFVEIAQGIQGLLHVSDMTWERNANPKDILKDGQEIEVEIKELDKENQRVKLLLSNKGEDPWNNVENKYKINDIVKVKITKIMPFGAFAELELGVEGLIHISQMAEKRITKPEEVVSVGEELNAKILNIDLENKKIELTIKELEGTSYDLNYSEELKENENSDSKVEKENSNNQEV